MKWPTLSCTTRLLFSVPALFFSREEMATLYPAEAPPLHLSAILYTDSTHWSVWIKGQLIRPETAQEREDFQVETVTPTSVTVLRIGGGKETLFLDQDPLKARMSPVSDKK